jgi:hypothetical protein
MPPIESKPSTNWGGRLFAITIAGGELAIAVFGALLTMERFRPSVMA